MGLDRRAVLKVGGAIGMLGASGAPAFSQAKSSTLRFIPQADLSSLDPIVTTSYAVRNYGYMVFDTLYAMDGAFNIRPQMAEGHTVSDDGLTWTIRLRDKLKFHDGEPVWSRDCVASIKRWGARDGLGQSILAITDDMPIVDDRTWRFRLKVPFPFLADALGKASTPVPFIMPERIASGSPSSPIREAVGSGPFRFLASEWVSGSSAAFSRFEGYVPCDEQPEGKAGGKKVFVDRVEWKIVRIRPRPPPRCGAGRSTGTSRSTSTSCRCFAAPGASGSNRSTADERRRSSASTACNPPSTTPPYAGRSSRPSSSPTT